MKIFLSSILLALFSPCFSQFEIDSVILKNVFENKVKSVDAYYLSVSAGIKEMDTIKNYFSFNENGSILNMNSKSIRREFNYNKNGTLDKETIYDSTHYHVNKPDSIRSKLRPWLVQQTQIKYKYENGRLTEALKTEGDLKYTMKYSYDNMGNIVNISTLDTNNRIVKITIYTYNEYNSNDALIEEVEYSNTLLKHYNTTTKYDYAGTIALKQPRLFFIKIDYGSTFSLVDIDVLINLPSTETLYGETGEEIKKTYHSYNDNNLPDRTEVFLFENEQEVFSHSVTFKYAHFK